jgi:hypothetical protein
VTHPPELTGTTVTPAPAWAPLADSDIAQTIERYFHDEGLLRSEHVQVAVTQGVALLSMTRLSPSIGSRGMIKNG